MLQSKTRWLLKKADETIIHTFINELNQPRIVAELLVNRGIKTVDAARSFLYAAEQDFYDPFLLSGMEEAVKRIVKAVKNNEKITIYGDYDADGVSSTTVLKLALNQLGAEQVDWYIPNRFTEGYGPNKDAFAKIKEKGTSLLITVDCGISAIEEAQLAKDLGMDYIVTDHHEPGPMLPEALAILHPKKPGETYPFSELAGAGVAMKLAHALLGELPEELIGIAAIGTIADLVPLQDENRLIAIRGLQALKKTNRPGLLALYKKAGIAMDSFNEDSIGFGIAPRINAVGRLEDADPAVELLLTNDQAEAERIAEEIDFLNKERQSIVKEITLEAMAEVESRFPLEQYPVLVIAKEGWNPGVVGIVASKLVEKYYRPTIILSIDREKGMAKGSARSIPGFDLFQNLSVNRELLPHFGGHPMAAGMTLRIEDVDELRSRLCRQAKDILTEEDFQPVTEIDGVVSIEEISLPLIGQMAGLAPYGMHNPKPRILIEGASVASAKKIGADKTHLKLALEENGVQLDSIGFGLGDIYDHLSPYAKVSAIGELAVNEWNNLKKPQLFLQDLSVTEWQLFDCRGNAKTTLKPASIPEKRKLILFREESKAMLANENEGILIKTAESAKAEELDGLNVAILDLPNEKGMIEALLEGKRPARMYLYFRNGGDDYFKAFPTREQFKWYYAMLLKKGPMDYKDMSEKLLHFKGWPKDTIDFMTKVFFELEFVTIRNGLISLEKNSPKRDLTESETYQARKARMELEQELLYAPSNQLYQYFNQQIGSRDDYKEETKQWI
ncbi:single-stranded-DNA-specific exonuclease RecJ [Pradoshia sp.]